MTRPLTPETLVYDLVQVTDPQISPDGCLVVYTRTTIDPDSKQTRSQVWLCDAAGGGARQLTHAGDHNGGARWSRDGTQLAFVSDRVPGHGLFVLPLRAPAEARELARHRQPISNLAWSPDGERIAYNTTFDPANPDEAAPQEGEPPPVRVVRRRDYKFDGRGFLGDVRQQTFIVSMSDGSRRQLTREALDHSGPEWSPDGRRIAVRRGYPGNLLRTQIALVDVVTGAVEPIGPAMSGQACAWAPGGERLLFTGSAEAGGQPDFYLYELADGMLRRLTDDLPFLPPSPGDGGASSPLIWLDDDEVLCHGIRTGGSGLYHLDISSGQTEPLVTWQAVHGGLSVSADRRTAVQERATLESAGDLALIDLGTGETRVIVASNTDCFREHAPAAWERIEVRRGGFAIDAWLFFPPDFDPARRYPVVLDIHGGPHGFYGFRQNATQQCLATHGFLVVAANPRGSSSYGRRFAAQVVGDNGGEDYRDLMAALDNVLERPYADRDRVGVCGYSYGGYMTAWILGQDVQSGSPRFKAAVCGAPRVDNASAYGSADVGPMLAGYQLGGTPWEQRERYAERSPSTLAHTIRTPTLIVHGEADERCPLNQGEQLFNTLMEVGCETEFVRYPGCSHLFIINGPPVYRVDLLTRQLAWFRAHLGEPR